MAYNRSHAKVLCSDDELELFLSSLADGITKLDDAALKSSISRARELRKKYQDLFRRQTVSIRTTTGSKRGNTSVANTRTEQKAKLFAETLQRFENRRAQLDEAKARAEARAKLLSMASTGTAKPAKGGAATPQPGSSRKKPATAAQRKAPSRDPHAATQRAHATASGKRAQAKRDKR